LELFSQETLWRVTPFQISAGPISNAAAKQDVQLAQVVIFAERCVLLWVEVVAAAQAVSHKGPTQHFETAAWVHPTTGGTA